MQKVEHFYGKINIFNEKWWCLRNVLTYTSYSAELRKNLPERDPCQLQHKLNMFFNKSLGTMCKTSFFPDIANDMMIGPSVKIITIRSLGMNAGV